ncbi:hypothetical protein OAF42_03015 [Planctomicrobium sp.]|nr:hypothetical protein [Planctomicrobium sp.]MDB4731195.1 hypothetical protein [bacterium]MDB4733395.1 hypothetical protein [Planctomicrobium sp.]
MIHELLSNPPFTWIVKLHSAYISPHNITLDVSKFAADKACHSLPAGMMY